VASDPPCAQASNATLMLLRRDGIGGARHCEQSRLPDPWRDNDISDVTG
jgi:hypothetical protein